MLVGGMDFTKLAITLKAAQGEAPAVLLKYGMFIQQIIDFVIVAFVIFMMIKGMNAMRRKQKEVPAAPPEPPRQEVLLAEIRDLLKSPFLRSRSKSECRPAPAGPSLGGRSRGRKAPWRVLVLTLD